MIKDFESKVENYSNEVAYSKYGIKESDFIEIIKKQLDNYNLIIESKKTNDNYIDSKKARKLLYSLHMKICEIQEIIE